MFIGLGIFLLLIVCFIEFIMIEVASEGNADVNRDRIIMVLIFKWFLVVGAIGFFIQGANR